MTNSAFTDPTLTAKKWTYYNERYHLGNPIQWFLCICSKVIEWGRAKYSMVEMLNQYLPTLRLVLKGPVYLKDKFGEMMVPLSIVSGNSSDGKIRSLWTIGAMWIQF
jgi:hypothetical protein